MPDYSTTGAVFPLKTYAITDVDTGLETFVVDGDQTERFEDGDLFSVVGSTGNDGEYTVSSTSYSEVNDETTITVAEDITDATVDGTIIHGEKADALPITESHDDAADRDAAEPEEYAGAHGRRWVNEIRALGEMMGNGFGCSLVAGAGLVIYFSQATLLKGSGTPVHIAAGTLTMADNDDNYVEVDISGTVSSNVVGFTTGRYPLGLVTTLASAITNIEDKRSILYLAEFAEANLDDFGPSFNAATELTIAAGVVARSQGVHSIDTQSDDAADDLDTINGAPAGEDTILWVRSVDAARVVTLKDGAGNLALNGRDIVLDDPTVYVSLMYDSASSTWYLAGGGGAGGVPAPSTDERLVKVDGVAGDVKEATEASLNDTDDFYGVNSMNIGPDAAVDTKIKVQVRDDNLQLDSGTGDLSRFWIRDTITQGGTGTGDDAEYYGYRASITMDDAGGFFEEMFGTKIDLQLNDGTADDMLAGKFRVATDASGGKSPVVSDTFRAGEFDAAVSGGVLNAGADLEGLLAVARADTFGGATTINSDIYGLRTRASADSGVVVNGDVYGHYLFGDISPTPAGTAFELYLDGTGNWDYGVYQNDAFPNFWGGNHLHGPGVFISPNIFFHVADQTMTLDSGTGDKTRFWIRDKVTTGGTGTGDDAEYYGYRLSSNFDDAGGFFEEMFGSNINMQLNDGTMDRLYGVKGACQVDGFGGRSPVLSTQFYGGHFDVTASGATINADQVALHSAARSDTGSGATAMNGDIYGHFSRVSSDAGVSIAGDVFNHYLFGNLVPVPSGNAYELYLDGTGNWTYGIYQNSTYPNELKGTLKIANGFGMNSVTVQAQQAHIIDADGTLADITTKFNTLLADLEGFGFLATS